MINEKLLKSKLILKNLTYKDLADILKIDVTTLYRKINGSSDFYRGEIVKICEVLNLTAEEMTDIFFTE